MKDEPVDKCRCEPGDIHACFFCAYGKDEPVALKPIEARKTFPILGSGGQTRVDWQLVLDHAAQAERNHRQTVQRLAERGGLSWDEMLAVLTDRAWRAVPDAEKADAAALCRAIEARYLAATRPADYLVRQLVEAASPILAQILDEEYDEYGGDDESIGCDGDGNPLPRTYGQIRAFRDALKAARAQGYGG